VGRHMIVDLLHAEGTQSELMREREKENERWRVHSQWIELRGTDLVKFLDGANISLSREREILIYKLIPRQCECKPRYNCASL
jgi:hypothetical protein